MIRGVNKQIIEISDTGNRSFERAILFVRPDSQRLDADTLHGRALSYLAQLKLRPWFYSRGGLLGAIPGVVTGIVIGAAVTALILLL